MASITPSSLCTNKEPTTKKANWYGNANKTSMATPDKVLLKRILGAHLNTKDSTMIARLNSATTEVTGLQKRVINVIKEKDYYSFSRIEIASNLLCGDIILLDKEKAFFYLR